MTFQNDCIVVDGNQYKAQTWRMAMLAAMAEQQGITDALDLIVLASGSGMGLNIQPGSCVISGQDSAFPNASMQGSYFGYNVGVDNSLAPATTGASPRSDLIIARAEDPTFAGTPWSGGGPAGQIIFPRIVANVANNVTVAPAGQSAIALARCDIPINTTVMTQGMITDLRNVARPMRQKSTFFLNGNTWSTPSSTPGSTGPAAWPANANFSVAIPSWATQVLITLAITGLFNTGVGTAAGTHYVGIGGTIPAPTVQSTSLWYTALSTQPRYATYGTSQAAIPASIRNTTQTMTVIVNPSNVAGALQVDSGANLTVELEFLQYASAT